MMKCDVVLITVGDDRPEFYSVREPYVLEQRASLKWVADRYAVADFGVVNSLEAMEAAICEAGKVTAHCLLLHVPIWAPPAFSLNISRQLELPVMLIGNSLPQTSSMVGLLGAGGALDQVGIRHERIFDMNAAPNQEKIGAFIQAARVRNQLKGQRYGRFGGCSLGIFTAEADPAQWQQLFGVETVAIDQIEIAKEAESYDRGVVDKHLRWLMKGIKNGADLSQDMKAAAEKQVRSYLATKKIIEAKRLSFVAVKCQPELSDGYVTQCVSHMLLNSSFDAEGMKPCVVHACESDSDGVLTMRILNMLSQGKATALLDIRYYDKEADEWIFANCGALACDFYEQSDGGAGISQVSAVKHAFGKGGGLAYSAMASPRAVTLARLCRKAGQYKMTVLSGEVVKNHNGGNTTMQFPQARVKDERGCEIPGELRLKPHSHGHRQLC